MMWLSPLLARRTAIVQSAISVAGLVVSFISGGIRSGWQELLIPAIVPLLFTPALLVQAYQIGRALKVLRLASASQRGFAVMPVVPLETTGESENGAPSP